MLRVHVLSTRRTSTLLVLLAVSACSTSDYAAPIAKFKTSADAATKAYTDMNALLAETTLDFAIASIVNDKTLPKTNTIQRIDDCGTFTGIEPTSLEEAERCRTEFSLTSQEASISLQREDYTSPLGNLIGVLEATQEYATNLAAVQQANTTEQVNSSIDSIQASIAKLSQAAAAAEGKPPTLPPDLPQAAGQAVKWAFGQYIESVKFNALKEATAAARDPLARAQVAVKRIAEVTKSIMANELQIAAQVADDTVDTNSDTSIRAMLRAHEAYDDFMTAPLSSMFDNLVIAHQALADGLEEDSHISIRRALEKMDEIEAQAKMLEKIVKDLRAALDT